MRIFIFNLNREMCKTSTRVSKIDLLNPQQPASLYCGCGKDNDLNAFCSFAFIRCWRMHAIDRILCIRPLHLHFRSAYNMQPYCDSSRRDTPTEYESNILRDKLTRFPIKIDTLRTKSNQILV